MKGKKTIKQVIAMGNQFSPPEDHGRECRASKEKIFHWPPTVDCGTWGLPM